MTIKAIRLRTGLTQREFAGVYHIPLQTLKQWESNRGSTSFRAPPDYVVHMIRRLAEQDFPEEGIVKDQKAGHR
ncbi:MAG: helix-turn-helix domain-containing protein [Mogibacterium sp.]|nr:helix-turn-helix domain-containing protein [Mogibacterium sp.]